MIRLLVADDHPLVRQGIRMTVASHPDMRVTAEAADGHAVLQTVASMPLDVVLLDVSMPGPGFAAVMAGIRQHCPSLPILVLSMHSEEQYAVRAIKLGAAGYLAKDCPPQQLAEAIRRVARGGRFVTPGVAERLAVLVGASAQRPRDSLSERELRVLTLAAQGKTVKEIAGALGVSPKTVSTYRSRTLRKLNLRSQAEAISYAIHHGLVD